MTFLTAVLIGAPRLPAVSTVPLLVCTNFDGAGSGVMSGTGFFALNTTLLDFAASTIWAGITNNHAFFAFFLGFFAVFAAALKAAAVGAPLAPTFLIFSPLPALNACAFLGYVAIQRHQQYLPKTSFEPFFAAFFLTVSHYFLLAFFLGCFR